MKNSNGNLLKIISGGQTGVDRAALDAAIHCNIRHAGWCPKSRKAEDGEIDQKYLLTETDSSNYAERTEFNVKNSDGTLIFTMDSNLSGGTMLTKQFLIKHNKPFLIITLDNMPDFQFISQWLFTNNISCLNIAGPRESKHPGIYSIVNTFLTGFFQSIKKLAS